MAQFAQYAVVASQEALEDAGWYPKTDYDQEMTVTTRFPMSQGPSLLIFQGVCIGSGIGSFEDVYDTSIAYDKGVSIPPPYSLAQALTLPFRALKKCPPSSSPAFLST